MLAQMDPLVLRTICTTAVALIVIACVLWNIRQRRLREIYAMIWLVFGFAMLLFGMFPRFIVHLAVWSGIYYLTLIMGFFFICLFVFILQVSVLLSSHSDSVCTLTQRAAIAKEEIESLKREIEDLRLQLDHPGAKEPDGDTQNRSGS